MRIKSILFDFDDTLIESQKARKEAMEKVASEISNLYRVNKMRTLNVLLDIERNLDRAGIFDRDVWWQKAANILGININEKQIKMLTEIYWSTWIKNSILYPDTLHSLYRLKKCGFKVGILANDDGKVGHKRYRIEHSGIPLNLLDLILVAGDDTNERKPDPKPFIKALEVLNEKPYEAIYVGDKTYADVPGAKSIGMWTIIVNRDKITQTFFYELSDREKPDIIIGSLYQLTYIIKC